MKLKWTLAVKRKDWVPSKWSKICSAHFREADVDRTVHNCIRIREGAIPKIFPAISETTHQWDLKRKKENTVHHTEFSTKKLRTELNKSQDGLKLNQKKK
uniref:THAP-type domain-containing protein n=1 Tax=Clastoptera arizonana TaxID=38151 RepID=A0A1B6D8R6_9HEMI